MDTNFAYLRDEDDNFFITLGDNHRDRTVAALPLYAPDPHGDRDYDGTRLSKQPKDGTADLTGGPYEDSPVRFGALEIDRERIEETVLPHEDHEDIYANLDDHAQGIYEEVTDVLDDEDLMIIGSDTYDVGTGSSDLDLVYTGDYEEFIDRKEDLLEETSLEEVGQDWLEDRIEDHSDRYDVPEAVADYHHRSPQQRFMADGLKVGFSPSHEPGSFEDYQRPEGESEDYSSTATVIDTNHNDSWPRMVEIEDEDDEIDLVTYFWAYGGSFEEGQEVCIEGERFEDTVYLREPGQFAAPEEVLEERQ